MSELRDIGMSLYDVPQFPFVELTYFVFQILMYLEKIAAAKWQRMTHCFQMNFSSARVDNSVLVSVSFGEVKKILLILLS